MDDTFFGKQIDPFEPTCKHRDEWRQETLPSGTIFVWCQRCFDSGLPSTLEMRLAASD